MLQLVRLADTLQAGFEVLRAAAEGEATGIVSAWPARISMVPGRREAALVA